MTSMRPMSLTATTSSSVSYRSRMARYTSRPMRPNPLMPTLTAISEPPRCGRATADRPSGVAFEFVEGRPDHAGTGPELGLLGRAQREREGLDHPRAADEAGQGDRHVLHPGDV